MTSTLTPERLPIVTIGGFLGAGKTTLVNHILHSQNQGRTVVFVNDFGAINIDYSMIDTVEADRISLKNGCVCCSLNDDFVASVADFAREAEPPDLVVVEASGVSDPRALDASLDALEAANLTQLDSRIYVIDSDNFHRFEFEDTEQIIDHAAASDLIILNKTDLASNDAIAKIEKTLAEAAPFSRLLKASHCGVHAELLTGLTARIDLKSVKQALRKTKAGENHIDKYTQWSFETESVLNRDAFDVFARSLPDICLRAKGFLRFAEAEDKVFTFNLVGHRATLEQSSKPVTGAKSQIIAIGITGKVLPDKLSRGFEKTLVRH
ncbi:MAG: CobW family GTP-binding protein [Hyphomicrobiales bacterium]